MQTSSYSRLRFRRSRLALTLALPALLAWGGQASAATSTTDVAVYKNVDLSNSRDPRISKFYVGDTVKYTLQVVNNGPVAADGATLIDTVEPGLVGLNWTCTVVGGGAQCPAPSGTGLPNFTIPKLPAGSEMRITYTAKVTAVDPQLTNTAQIQLPAGMTDSNPANNKDAVYICTFDTDLPRDTTLTLSKTSNGPWTVGQSGATYTLTVANPSNSPTRGTITVKDLLPTGITPTSTSFSPAPNWTCSVSGQLVTCTTTSVLAETGSVTLTLPVNVGSSAVGSVTNKAAVGGGDDPDNIPDPATCTPGTTNPANQCAQTTTTVTQVNTPVPTQCTTLYGLMVSSTGSLYDGRTINVIDPSTNTVGTRIATLPRVGSVWKGYQNLTSAALALSPDGRTFYVATDAIGYPYNVPARLWMYDSSTGSWTEGSTFSGVSGRIVRMAMTSSGVGYAMDSGGNFWSFNTSGTVTSLGQLKPASTATGVSGFYENGDFFATADGKLYLLSAQTSGNVNLWFVDPRTLTAEYLGNLTSASATVQYNGLAAVGNTIYAANSAGRLNIVDPAKIGLTPVGGTTAGSTDLASCSYPDLRPIIEPVKSYKKVAGQDGSAVQPGDTLEYTIVVRNAGQLPAGGATFRDVLPEGVTYVADSARVNGATTTVLNGQTVSLTGTAYPFAQPVGICSSTSTGAACTTQVLHVDTTPGTLDREAVITFRVKVNDPFTLTSGMVRNVAVITYTDGNTPPIPIPTNPTETPIYRPVKLTAIKTVRNITAGGPVGTSGSGKPGDVLEYCITTTSIGSGVATNLRFADTVPSNTTFLAGGFGLAGQDIRYTDPVGQTQYLTAAADGDAGVLTSGRVYVNGAPARLEPGQKYQVCFRTTIK